MEKPISFTLQRFLQTNSSPRAENMHTVNLRQCTFNPSADESPNKNHYSSKGIERRKRHFEASDEDLQCFKPVKSPLRKNHLTTSSYKSDDYDNIRLGKNPAKSPEPSEVSSSNKKYKCKSSTSRTRHGRPKSVIASKHSRNLIETYKYSGKNRDTKRLDDFLEQHSPYIDDNKLFKAKTRVETSPKKSATSPDSTTNSSRNSTTSTKCIPKSDNKKPVLSTNTKSRITHGSMEVGPSKTPKLDEFLQQFSQKGKVEKEPYKKSFNVSISFGSSDNDEEKENKLIFPKTQSKQLPLQTEESEKTMFSFFKKSKKYDKHPWKSFGRTVERKGAAAPVQMFVGRENCDVRRQKEKMRDKERRLKNILEERKRRWEKVQEEEKSIRLVNKGSCSDNSEDSIIRKTCSWKPIKIIRTKLRDHATRDCVSKSSPLRNFCTQSSSKVLVDPKNLRTIWEDDNREPEINKLDIMKAKSCFPVRKPLEELKGRQNQTHLTGKGLFLKESDNILNMFSNTFQASSPNLGQIENNKSTNKSKNRKHFLRKSSSESNLVDKRKNKPTPKLTFNEEPVSSKNAFRFSSFEDIREEDSKLGGNEEGHLETVKGIQKNDSATTDFEMMLRNMAKYFEYTTGNPFVQERKTGNNNKVETTRAAKSQKTLLSSEGFHESMSTETMMKNNEEIDLRKSQEKENSLKSDIWAGSNEKIVSKGSASLIYKGKSKTESVQAPKALAFETVGCESNRGNILSLKFVNTINIPPMESSYQTPSFKKKVFNDSCNIIQDSLPKRPLNNMKSSKDNLSDPLSLKSAGMVCSPKEISGQYGGLPINTCVQVQKIVSIQKPDGSQNNRLMSNTQKTQQKEDKFGSQALKDLCRILERDKWEQHCTDSLGKNSNDSAIIGKTNDDVTSQDGESYDLLSQFHSETFRKQSDNVTSSQLQKDTIGPQSEADHLKDNNELQTQTNEYTAYLLSTEEVACQTQDEEGATTQPQQSFTQQQSAPKNKIHKRKGAYNITEDCILFGDNLLKELLEERPQIVEAYNKNKVKIKNHEEADDILAKTYIKRYKKGSTKIFKIKRRLKVKHDDVYRPPEDHIIDRFTERLKNNFEDKSSSEREDDDSVSTPSSYVSVSDETKSEPLSTGSTKLPKHQRLLREGVNKLSKNRDLLFSRYSDSAPKDFDSATTLNRIYEIILGILDDYDLKLDPYIKCPKNIVSNYTFRNDRYQMAEMLDYTSVVYKRSPKGTKFNLLLFVLNKIRILLETGTKLTKRELYYQLKTMVNFQSTTDTVIRDISRILNVGVWALNLTAQKGLVYGNLKLTMGNGETINCNVAGTTVPKDVMDICEIQSDAYFILVVEKESVFHKLLEEDLPRRLTRPFIMITGKGYPDLNTQLFLKKLWMVMTIPVFILVDADPHGIAIMLNYRFGSMANAHVSEHLAIPKARWIGVFPSEINKLSLTFEVLTKREINKTRQLLDLQCVKQNEKIQEQLQTLFDSETKTGIESVMKTHTYLSHRYLSTKFYLNDLI